MKKLFQSILRLLRIKTHALAKELNELTTIQEEVSLALSNLKDLQVSLQTRHRSNGTRLSASKGQLAEVETTLQRWKTVAQHAVDNHEEGTKDLRDEYQKAAIQVQNFEGQKAVLESRISQLEANRTAINSQIVDAQANYTKLEHELTEIQFQYETCQENIKYNNTMYGDNATSVSIKNIRDRVSKLRSQSEAQQDYVDTHEKDPLEAIEKSQKTVDFNAEFDQLLAAKTK